MSIAALPASSPASLLSAEFHVLAPPMSANMATSLMSPNPRAEASLHTGSRFGRAGAAVAAGGGLGLPFSDEEYIADFAPGKSLLKQLTPSMKTGPDAFGRLGISDSSSGIGLGLGAENAGIEGAYGGASGKNPAPASAPGGSGAGDPEEFPLFDLFGSVSFEELDTSDLNDPFPSIIVADNRAGVGCHSGRGPFAAAPSPGGGGSAELPLLGNSYIASLQTCSSMASAVLSPLHATGTVTFTNAGAVQQQQHAELSSILSLSSSSASSAGSLPPYSPTAPASASAGAGAGAGAATVFHNFGVQPLPHRPQALGGMHNPSIEELVLLGQPLWPVLKRLVERVRAALLQHKTGHQRDGSDSLASSGFSAHSAAAASTASSASSVENDIQLVPELGAVYYSNPDLGSDDTATQAVEVQEFLLHGIGIYTALLEKIDAGMSKTDSDWGQLQAGLEANLNSAVAGVAAVPSKARDASAAGSYRQAPRNGGRRSGRRGGAGGGGGGGAAANDGGYGGGGGGGSPYTRKTRATLPKKATSCLKNWLFDHEDLPYPNDDEKDELILQTGLTVSQINNWFINARRRLLVRHTSP